MSTFKFYAVRYQVKEVARSVEFYTTHLGFTQQGPMNQAFAMVANGDLRLLLSGPGSSGARSLPDGRSQEPGGSNRIVLAVEDISAAVAALKNAGLHFRNEIETGPGGSQIQIEDPDGNPIEIFQPASR
jgi:glyoxylase I family protein